MFESWDDLHQTNCPIILRHYDLQLSRESSSWRIVAPQQIDQFTLCLFLIIKCFPYDYPNTYLYYSQRSYRSLSSLTSFTGVANFSQRSADAKAGHDISDHPWGNFLSDLVVYYLLLQLFSEDLSISFGIELFHLLTVVLLSLREHCCLFNLDHHRQTVYSSHSSELKESRQGRLVGVDYFT